MMTGSCRRRLANTSAVLMLVVGLAGCGGRGGRKLMPTPNLHVGGADHPFADVPEAFRSSTIDVMYVTDRKRTIEKDGSIGYGNERSGSLAFGLCLVEIGDGLSWESLVANSRVRKRSKSLGMSLSIVEQARLFETTAGLVKNDKGAVADFAAAAGQKNAVEKFHAELRRRLWKTPTKEAYVYVHGAGDSLESGAFVIGELWHFLGRRGVPIAYSWRAGAGQKKRAYARDRESGEFTVFHLKQFLRTAAALGEIERIHVIAQDSGAHVATTALGELFTEAMGTGVDPREACKIGNVVLASGDPDVDVMIHHLSAERLSRGAERVTVYATARERAIGWTRRLFGFWRRAEQTGLADLVPEMKQKLAALPHTNIIRARVKTDLAGHDYYRTSPAVSSDLILLLRDNRDPGAANGRPLTEAAHNYWRIDNDYRRN